MIFSGSALYPLNNSVYIRETRSGVFCRPSRPGSSPTALIISITASRMDSKSIFTPLRVPTSKSSLNSMFSPREDQWRLSATGLLMRSLALPYHRLNQAIGAIPTAIQHLNGVLLGVEENEEVIMPKQAHLLDGFILVHGQNDEFFTAGNQR